MAEDHIRYDLMAQEALRGVVRNVMADVAKKGLPGEHHFFVSFDTHGDGVQISPRMLAQYPEEMTIVLQHQFWDLNVTNDRFQVGLSFNGIPERLTVPFAAITRFFDPAVQFGLEFEPIGEEARVPSVESDAPARIPGEAKGAKSAPALSVPVPANPPPSKPAGEEPDKPSGGAEVVRLDRFRKK